LENEYRGGSEYSKMTFENKASTYNEQLRNLVSDIGGEYNYATPKSKLQLMNT
jgi:hypothetical protein